MRDGVKDFSKKSEAHLESTFIETKHPEKTQHAIISN
jgi:hypothetical protein